MTSCPVGCLVHTPYRDDTPPPVQGVLFEQKLVEVDEAYRNTYDQATDLWHDALLLIKEAKEDGSLLVTPRVWGAECVLIAGPGPFTPGLYLHLWARSVHPGQICAPRADLCTLGRCE